MEKLTENDKGLLIELRFWLQGYVIAQKQHEKPSSINMSHVDALQSALVKLAKEENGKT
jgi:hypothetical protein